MQGQQQRAVGGPPPVPQAPRRTASRAAHRRRRRLPARGLVLLTGLTLAAVVTAALPDLLPVGLRVDPSARAAALARGPLPTGDRVAADVVRQTHAYGPAGLEHELDVYLPAGEPVRPRPTVLFLHGGSWEIGDKVEYVAEATRVAERGWTAVSLNYRRTPTAPWPAPLNDVRHALVWLQEHADQLGIDVQRTGALGDSVGAQLAGLLGRPIGGMVPVRAVVSWSGISDMTGLLQQASSGGCAQEPCEERGLVRKVVRDLMRCTPQECADDYQDASPAAGLSTGPATYATVSEAELVDPRQAWALDSALNRAGVASRVRVLPGRVHGRGYQHLVWEDSLRFLEAALTPERSAEFPRAQVRVTLGGPADTAVGLPVELRGRVEPRQPGSSVAMQQQDGDGRWRTRRVAVLAPDGQFALRWTPQETGTVTWRARWQGSGGVGESEPVAVQVR